MQASRTTGTADRDEKRFCIGRAAVQSTYLAISPADLRGVAAITLTVGSCLGGAIIVGMGGELSKTLEGSTKLRCMLVGLDERLAGICAAALMPIAMVRVAGAKEACARMSTVLPLMVVASRSLGDPLLAELRDQAQTCASELVVIEEPTPPDVVQRLHDTLRRADRRRM